MGWGGSRRSWLCRGDEGEKVKGRGEYRVAFGVVVVVVVVI